ncbi:hypothetical protein LTS18_013403 [Coniosporium uncinatum]|uniref:Uncharacterized protein n=1 Tax=Coniosporium uncinatum TaxID=93489 RepID=A0ACC3CWM6_9PEZI|nr:hypothetical protein LTS18_013403 [Coniosporium uncinatum]
MATPSNVKLSTTQKPAFYLPNRTQDAADRASELLQENHEKHHIFFNKDGFHNHIAHHLLTLWALAASPEQIQKHYDDNKSYQRNPVELERNVVDDMHDPASFKKYLGDEHYYHDFLVFFQKEMEQKGWQNVINEYLFKGDVRADDMLVRSLAGFLHPLIHIGFAIEHEQPAIAAEGLAQAAVHDNWMGPLLLNAEKAAQQSNVKQSKTLVQLLDEIYEDKELSNAPKWSDGNKLRDGIVKRVGERMVSYARQYVVSPDELEEKTAEMINAAVYYTGGAQHPPKQVKFDFYYMHCVNCSIFFSAFLKQSWLSTESKVRLLEWKGRNDIAMYASRRSPKPLMDEITNYRPKEPSGWDAIFERIKNLEDDGHGSKLVRALAHGQEVCKPYEQKENFRIKGDMWLQLGHMAADSVTDGGDTWVRSAGFDEAWEKFEDRPMAQL